LVVLGMDDCLVWWGELTRMRNITDMKYRKLATMIACFLVLVAFFRSTPVTAGSVVPGVNVRSELISDARVSAFGAPLLSTTAFSFCLACRLAPRDLNVGNVMMKDLIN
jgi:hypothetical protein